MAETARVTSIELFRVIAALAIMTYHFFTVYIDMDGIIRFATVFVEFFFILSGFFMMKHLTESKEPLSSAAYTLGKASSFYPVYIIVFALQFILFVIMNGLSSASDVLGQLFHFKWEALLLQTAGFIPDPQFGVDYLLGQTWYLSAMLLSLLIAYPIAKHAKKWYVTLICPLVIITFYSYIMQTEGTVNVGNEYLGIIMSAILRGLAGTCVGSLCYQGYAHIKEHPIAHKKTAYLLETACYLCFIALFFMPASQTEADTLFFILVFTVMVIFAFSNTTPISVFLNSHFKKLFTWLGSMSLYLYLAHWSVMSVFNIYGQGLNTAIAAILYFAGTFILGWLLKLLNDKRKNAIPVAVTVCVLLAFAFVVPYTGLVQPM